MPTNRPSTVGFLLVPGFALMSYAAAMEPLRAANLLSGKELYRWWHAAPSGEPVIAFGSDIDGIPKASQKPGVAYHDPIIEGAPGHGEGHNSGQVVNILAALAVKKVMERERLPGTLVLWPGVAEELLGTKAWFVRDGRFRGVDAVFFTHVGDKVTFEVVAESFGLIDDVALQRIARLVHYLDAGGIPVDEAAGFEMLVRGLQAVHADDDELLAAAIPVFDALYAAAASR